jgi:lipid-binding SYLF domain-containing protein
MHKYLHIVSRYKLHFIGLFLIFLMTNLVTLQAARSDEIMDARHIIDTATVAIEKIRSEYSPKERWDSLIQRTKGIFIVPAYYKIGFIIGGSYGDGVLLKRNRDGGFGDPAFYRITSGSVGLQVGLQSSEIAFLILSDKGMEAILKDEFKVGANIGIAVGAVGAGAEAATTSNIGKEILAFSQSAGLFAGGSLVGSIIKPREDLNAAVYGNSQNKPNIIIKQNRLAYSSQLKQAIVEGLSDRKRPPPPQADSE